MLEAHRQKSWLKCGLNSQQARAVFELKTKPRLEARKIWGSKNFRLVAAQSFFSELVSTETDKNLFLLNRNFCFRKKQNTNKSFETIEFVSSDWTLPFCFDNKLPCWNKTLLIRITDSLPWAIEKIGFQVYAIRLTLSKIGVLVIFEKTCCWKLLCRFSMTKLNPVCQDSNHYHLNF